MGARRARRDRFLAQHPWCCFCGGSAPTATEDHIPARAFFFERFWPEGFVFPACASCNNQSSYDEALISWLTRLSFENRTPEMEQDLRLVLKNVKRLAPDIWAKVRPHSRVETRRRLREGNMPTAIPGMDDIVHTVGLPVEFLSATERYGIKLAKALHYRHLSRIVPRDAIVKVRAYTNAEAARGDVPDQVLGLLQGFPEVRRDHIELTEQFNYRYVTAGENDGSAFLVSFGGSVFVLSLILCDPVRHAAAAAEAAKFPSPESHQP